MFFFSIRKSKLMWCVGSINTRLFQVYKGNMVSCFSIKRGIVDRHLKSRLLVGNFDQSEDWIWSRDLQRSGRRFPPNEWCSACGMNTCRLLGIPDDSGLNLHPRKGFSWHCWGAGPKRLRWSWVRRAFFSVKFSELGCCAKLGSICLNQGRLVGRMCVFLVRK